MVLAPDPPETMRGFDPRGVERLGAILVDQRHRALHHVLGDEIGVVGMGDEVDQRIAQAQNVYGFGHRTRAPRFSRALLALPRREVNSSSRRVMPRAPERPAVTAARAGAA